MDATAPTTNTAEEEARKLLRDTVNKYLDSDRTYKDALNVLSVRPNVRQYILDLVEVNCAFALSCTKDAGDQSVATLKKSIWYDVCAEARHRIDVFRSRTTTSLDAAFRLYLRNFEADMAYRITSYVTSVIKGGSHR